MFSDFSEDIHSTVLKYFPERQIYLRSGGEVSYYVLSTRVQVAVTSFAMAMMLWCLFTMFNVFWGNNPLRAPSQQNKIIKAEYERLLQDAEEKYDTARQQLTVQQENFEKAAKTFQEKHTAIARLVNQPVLDTNTPIFKNAQYSKGEFLLAPTIRDTVARTKRSEHLQTASLESGLDLNNPLIKLDTTQNEILLAAEEATIDNIDRNRAIIEATDMSVEDVLNAGAYGRGGPHIEIAGVQDNVSPRLRNIKIRAYEARLLDDAVNAMPLGYPVDAESYKSSSFGVRKDPFTKRPALHQAIDIASFSNAPIVATADGTIVFAGRRPGYGRVIDIDHGFGFVTRYAHMSKLQVKRGQKVNKGDKIGLMGSSGRSTSTHLHYEVRFQKKVYDPDKFLKAGQYVQ